MSDIHTMAPAEGAAMRYQLDAMIGALSPCDRPACEAGDEPVIALLASLYAARRAAQMIEDRGERPVRKGVRLAKR